MTATHAPGRQPGCWVALDALIVAQRAWERSQPQLFFELWPLEETPAVLTGTDGTRSYGAVAAAGVSSSGPSPLSPWGRSTPFDGGQPADPSAGICAGCPQEGTLDVDLDDHGWAGA